MTCIVGRTDGRQVWIGGDSAGVSGWDLVVRADEKVFKSGPFVMGFTSSFRMGQLLRYSLEVPEPSTDNLHRFMCTAFVDAIRECLKKGGYARKENEVEEGGTFLVGVWGRLFRIESDYQVAETGCGYDAVGCGASYALGALHALCSTPNPDPETTVLAALAASEQHNAGVRPPFIVLSTLAQGGDTRLEKLGSASRLAVLTQSHTAADCPAEGANSDH